MTNLNQWAIKWNIPYAALEDLRYEFGIIDMTPKKTKEGGSESAVQTRIRLEGVAKGINLMRNNVGVDPQTHVRYGLANDSPTLNKKCKSSDLIGIKPISIKPIHVNMVIGQFVAREIKKEKWVYAATEEEQAQLKFLEMIVAYGGDACFANSEGTL